MGQATVGSEEGGVSWVGKGSWSHYIQKSQLKQIIEEQIFTKLLPPY